MKRTELHRHTPLRRVRFPQKAKRKNPPLTIPRSRKYKQFIRKQPCLVCGKTPSEAAHTKPNGGMGIKGSDLRCVPLCLWDHQLGPRSYHKHPGGEKGFCEEFGIDLERTIQDLQRRYQRDG